MDGAPTELPFVDEVFTPLTMDPTDMVIMSWAEIDHTYPFQKMVSTRVFKTGKKRDDDGSSTQHLEDTEYAVKIIPRNDPNLSSEVAISNALNEFGYNHITPVFATTYGYILSKDLPPNAKRLARDTQHAYGLQHFVYLFMEPITFTFAELPDEPKVNEDFYFEVLIGLFYARKLLQFTHWDIHQNQLMFNRSRDKTTRSYRIDTTGLKDSNNAFYVTIESDIEPKLIDYGKSAMSITGGPDEEVYTDARWRMPQFKKFWNKSDIYHLSLIFSQREHLRPKFRDFLERVVLQIYKPAMYATKLENDSAANFANIAELLHIYFVETE